MRFRSLQQLQSLVDDRIGSVEVWRKAHATAAFRAYYAALFQALEGVARGFFGQAERDNPCPPLRGRGTEQGGAFVVQPFDQPLNPLLQGIGHGGHASVLEQ